MRGGGASIKRYSRAILASFAFYLFVSSARLNYASKECGAEVLSSNPEAENVKHVLLPSKDKYIITPCNVEKWLLIELCSDIIVESVSFANFEPFSSNPRTISMTGGLKHAEDTWNIPIVFNLTNGKRTQVFTLSKPIRCRVLKFDFRDHYGNYRYCPITSIKVFGSTLVQEMMDALEKSSIDLNSTVDSSGVRRSTSMLSRYVVEGEQRFISEDTHLSRFDFDVLIADSTATASINLGDDDNKNVFVVLTERLVKVEKAKIIIGQILKGIELRLNEIAEESNTQFSASFHEYMYLREREKSLEEGLSTLDNAIRELDKKINMTLLNFELLSTEVQELRWNHRYHIFVEIVLLVLASISLVAVGSHKSISHIRRRRKRLLRQNTGFDSRKVEEDSDVDSGAHSDTEAYLSKEAELNDESQLVRANTYTTEPRRRGNKKRRR